VLEEQLVNSCYWQYHGWGGRGAVCICFSPLSRGSYTQVHPVSFCRRSLGCQAHTVCTPSNRYSQNLAFSTVTVPLKGLGWDNGAQLTFVFLRHRDKLRYRETLSSLNGLMSSPTPSRGNFLKAYWYRWAASFIFPF
jgi:hypothetical protein